MVNSRTGSSPATRTKTGVLAPYVKNRKCTVCVFGFFFLGCTPVACILQDNEIWTRLTACSGSNRYSVANFRLLLTSPATRTKEVGQKVFWLFDPFLHIFRQKLAILHAIDFQGSFLFPKIQKNTLPTHIGKVG